MMIITIVTILRMNPGMSTIKKDSKVLSAVKIHGK